MASADKDLIPRFNLCFFLNKHSFILVTQVYLVFFAPDDQYRCCDQMQTVVQQKNRLLVDRLHEY